MRNIKTLTVGAVAALALVLAGCTPGEPAVSVNERVAAEDRTEAAPPADGGAPAAPAGPVLAWAAGNQIAWTEAPTEGPAGPITVQLTCEGLAHNVVLEGINNDEPIVECDAAGTYTGNTEVQPATYYFYCSIPGHEQGMNGELTIS